MRPSNGVPVVYLCRDVVDFRKGINGLAVLVEEALQHDPFSEQLFVFCNRKLPTGPATRVHLFLAAWPRKRLERARFKWPRKVNDEVITLTGQQLNWLLDGYDVMRMQRHERLHYSSVL